MRELRSKKLERLSSIADVARQPVSKPLVKSYCLSEDKVFPLVIEALDRDLDPVSWANGEKEGIESLLLKHGAILFRNFKLKTPSQFETFANAIEPNLFGQYGDLPKKQEGERIYQSTPYPEQDMILYHNESSHLERWPRKQMFFCELPAVVGGATPIVDCREILRSLPAGLVRTLEDKGLLYVRTFTPRLDVSWQEFYKTTDRAEVESCLRAAGIEWRWIEDNILQTRVQCPAVISHPLTGERAFFNQVQLHHPSCLGQGVREDLLALVGADRMPRQVYYGDGSPIDDETMSVIGRCYETCAVRFTWERGDVVLLDNMLAAHARDPYEGDRKIVVAMGAMVSRREL